MVIDGVEVRVLAPAQDYQAGPDAQNNDSLVLAIRFGKRSVLMAGDAERAVEGEMVADGLLQPVTLLKVGHHGSKTSSSEEFLSALHPQFALISAGYKNQFHHPHPSVLERLKEHGVTVLRTDEHGLITFRTDGAKVEFSGIQVSGGFCSEASSPSAAAAGPGCFRFAKRLPRPGHFIAGHAHLNRKRRNGGHLSGDHGDAARFEDIPNVHGFHFGHRTLTREDQFGIEVISGISGKFSRIHTHEHTPKPVLDSTT